MNVFELFGKIGINNKPANKAIDETTGKAEGAHGKLSVIFEKIGNLAVKAGKVMATGLAVGITAISSLTGAAVKNYAEYEQLVGGIETLFGAGGKSLEEYAQSVGKSVDDASAEYDKLINAQEDLLSKSKLAYKTAGLSANEYMETATSFSASLIQSVKGDTEKAAKLADQAIIDMSDNANKMGSSMESIQNAYQGFAKQNYTMLDNLKLGFGGTKEEMQRLLDEAGKISGVKYDISSFADITEAIHVMQVKMGIAGTTSKEAASTISGSIGMVKATWKNFLTGMSDPGQDFGELVGSLTESIEIALGNIIPKLVQALPRVVKGLSQVIQILGNYLPDLLSALLPGLITGATELLSELGSSLPRLFLILFDDLLPQVSQAFVTFLEKVFSLPEGSLKNLTEGLNLGFATISSMFDVLFGFLSEKDNIDMLTKLGMDPGTAQTIITTTVQIGESFRSAFETVITLASDGAGKIADFFEWFQKGGPAVDAFKSAIVGITAAWTGYKVITGTIQAIETARNTLLAIGNGLMLARFVQSGALTAAEGAQAAATMGATGAFTAFNAVLSINPIFLVIGAIAALVAGLVWFFTQTETGRQMWASFVEFLSNAWNSIVEFGTKLWQDLADFFSNLWDLIVNAAQTYWNTLITFYTTIWSKLVSVGQFFFNMLFNVISTVWTSISSFVSDTLNTIFNTVSSVFNNVWVTVTNIWNGIKNSISDAIEGAKNIVSNTIEKIKGFFNFEFKWPHLKMPHFTFEGSMNPLEWAEKGVPSIGVEWYAKGGIMTGPTVFGMNGNNLMVGGEAGSEAVLPLNKETMGMLASLIMDQITDKIVIEVPKQDSQPVYLQVDGQTFAKLIVGHISNEQAQRMIILDQGGAVGW
nr:MAG TPA: tail tape measure protein [Caudoviricetes sp.]